VLFTFLTAWSGFYTVADTADGVLKVMRSYQYYAAHAISDRVEKMRWGEKNQLGGYIWHTTGLGKTMTSFKSAQLIANSKDADKVVFLMDRIELGTQSLRLNKQKLVAYQASPRGGVLYGKMNGSRVCISGKAALFSEAMIYIGQ